MDLTAGDFLLQRHFTLSDSDADNKWCYMQNFRVTLHIKLFTQIPLAKANGKFPWTETKNSKNSMKDTKQHHIHKQQ